MISSNPTRIASRTAAVLAAALALLASSMLPTYAASSSAAADLSVRASVKDMAQMSRVPSGCDSRGRCR